MPILGPVCTTKDFDCFAKKSVNSRKPFLVRTIVFTNQNFLNCHQTTKMLSRTRGGLAYNFLSGDKNYLFLDSYPSLGRGGSRNSWLAGVQTLVQKGLLNVFFLQLRKQRRPRVSQSMNASPCCKQRKTGHRRVPKNNFIFWIPLKFSSSLKKSAS